MRYAIQGILGSFHHIALEKYLQKKTKAIGAHNIIPCLSFPDLAKTVGVAPKSSPIMGVMAIENTSVGSLLYNYNLIQQFRLKILGEVYIPIRQNLIVNKGTKLDDIKEVCSHPIALQQCITFLSQKKWKLVETQDTALSAKTLKEKPSTKMACVAGALAAEFYGLEILVKNINDFKKNHTRFLIVSRFENEHQLPQKGNYKASVQFYVKHKKGCLASVLNEISTCNMNLSKLQSFAMPGTHFKYNFHADIEFQDMEKFNILVKKIQKLTEKLTIHGIYQRAH